MLSGVPSIFHLGGVARRLGMIISDEGRGNLRPAVRTNSS
jgi:hypothetical protein